MPEPTQSSEFAFREGDTDRLIDRAFETNPEETTSAEDSQKETPETTETDNTQSPEGDKSTHGADIPFNEDPRIQDYLERTLNKKYEAMQVDFEKKLNDAVAKAKTEIGQGFSAKEALPEKVPRWFGGDQAQWDEFVGFLDQRFSPIAQKVESIGQMERATAEATDYFRNEMVAIENDRALNPQGIKFNKELADRLLELVMENDLVDSQGRWNYKAAWRLLQQQQPAAQPAPKPAAPAIKTKIAGATSSTNKGSEGKPAFKTKEDFQKRKPW